MGLRACLPRHPVHPLTRPFVQQRFADLPERPHRPHGFYELPEHRVHVWTEAFGDTEVSYRVAGEGPPLLALHGLMTTGYSWRYAWPGLADHFRVVMPDLVGCGRTSKPDRPYRLEDVVEWIAALMDALDLGGCRVIGNSMGGYLMMWTALQHPGLLGPLLVLHAPGLPTARMYALWTAMRLPGSEALLRSLVGRDPLRWAHGQVHYYDESLKSLEEAREYGEPLATREGCNAFARYLRHVMDVREMSRLKSVLAARHEAGCRFVVPVRLIYARTDPMVPPALGEQLAELLPESRLVWMTEASHFAHVDATERFLDLAVPWLTRSGH